jgi:hypothetical protein
MKRCLFPLSALLLAACGASGGLYLPDQAPKHDNPLKKKAQTQAPASPAPSGQTDSDSSQTPAPPEQNAPAPQP